MTTCAKTALKLLGDNSTWQPESYLINGMKQLDPISIIPTNSSQTLSKRTAALDTAGSPVDRSLIIIKRVDTIINVSKVIVNDTITREYEKTETILDLNAKMPADSTKIVTVKSVAEQIVILDTVTLYDTFTVIQYDTLKTAEATSNPDLSRFSGTKVTVSKPATSVNAKADGNDVYLDIESSSQKYTVPADYISLTTEVYSRISRSGSIASTNFSEEYTDIDGDGNLLTSSNNSTPLVELKAIYGIQNEKQSLSVQFDPGVDNSFSQTADNQIHLLERENEVSGYSSENIIFSNTHLTSGIDSSSLRIIKSTQNDSISAEITTFTIVNKDVFHSTTNSKLVKMQHSIQFRSGSAHFVNLTITPDSLLDVSTTPSKATIKIVIDYGKGSTGVFNGSIDYTKKTVTGVYSENGKEREFRYDDVKEESYFGEIY
jgi:hypothetical protein